uniref:Uncharacterized protein n=1 Tax=Panagrolaimus superbus TaxID=310955 RepID=A0A914YJI7_9BILA
MEVEVAMVQEVIAEEEVAEMNEVEEVDMVVIEEVATRQIATDTEIDLTFKYILGIVQRFDLSLVFVI